MFNTTFNNISVISWRSVLLVEETGVPGENHSKIHVPHLQKIGRLDFSLRDHKGEVEAWQGDFQQRHRDMFSQKWGVFSHFFFLHLKCVFANILLISFIFNIKFMFCICFIIIIDLIFIDFRFYSFLPLNLPMTSKCLFPSPYFLQRRTKSIWSL